MRRIWPIFLLCLPAAPLQAQQVPVRPDTTAPADTTELVPLSLRLGLKPLSSPFAITLPPAPAAGLLWLRPRHIDLAGEWRRSAEARLEAARQELWLESRYALARDTLAADTLVWLPEPPARRALPGDQPDFLPGALGEYTDIWMSVQGRGEMGGSWQRFRPCDALTQLTCEPSLFPQLRPDIQFGVQLGGTISERVHLNVDYDQRREFDAANNINVYYQGREDEMLRRVEIGDVSIRLPQSRYITQNIPAGNFGFKAESQIGPLELQAVWAEQKGDVASHSFRFGGGASGSLDQDRTLILDDAEYARGQFFFLVHPDSLAGSPHINVVSLRHGAGPPRLAPRPNTVVEVYRDERLTAHQLASSVDHFRGRAVAYGAAGDSIEVASSSYRRLNPDEYFLHASGVWLVLRTPLRQDEALAVSFVTESGDTVGTMDAQQVWQGGGNPRLRLIGAPVSGELHRPGRPTWDLEMHNVYRLDGSGSVLPASIELTVSIGEASGGLTHKEYQGDQVPLLKLFGLDEGSPFEQIDEVQIYQPRVQSSIGGEMAIGTFVVFPTLHPFAQPPPVSSLGLSAEEASLVLGSDANPTIYTDPDPVVRAGAARFRLSFGYSVRLDGIVSSFNLGGIGVREGSERITVDGRELVRNVDYTIDYDIGLVSLRDPQSIFAREDAEILATYEQKSIFDISPTSIFGLNATYRFGQHGSLDFIGLHQRERSIMARPQLGQEPASVLMTGMTGRFQFEAPWLDRGLARVPGLRAGGSSSIGIRGDVALSSPNPNTRGDAYLDDFEGSDDLPIALERRFWRLGSRPDDLSGAGGVFPAVLDLQTAAPLVWQEAYMTPSGVVGGALPPEYIDRNLRIAGRGLMETVLWMNFGDAGSPPGERLWRSVTTPLSTTGRDLSRAEYLEFYALTSSGEPYTLVFDIGSVSEDAFWFDEQGNLSGVDSLGRPWGLGVLDTEMPVELGPWNTAADERGMWAETCRAQPGVIYAMRDPRVNCSRGNGLPDTEDLAGNGVLDPNDGPYFRYVVHLDETSPYFVRETGGGEFRGSVRLFRIPLRDIAAIPVNGATEASWRAIRHMRMSVIGEASANRIASGQADFALSRMRIVGSRWTKRDTYGVFSGMLSAELGASAGAAKFSIGEASSLTHGADYASPPGVQERLQDPSAGFGPGGQQFNEKSLSMSYADLGPGERAEVYFRYLQQPRSLLTYRQIRLWAVPRSGNWGASGDQYLLVKIGSDGRNYYLHRTPLRDAVGDRVTQADWLPEVVIDFERFFQLKAEAEQQLLTNPPPAGEQLVLWSEDSTYAIVLEDRARAPNLAAVRELTLGVYNDGGLASSGEVWINELRLSEALRDPGMAGSLDMDVRAGDVLSASVQLGSQDPLFRQLNQDASFLRSGHANISTTLAAGRLLPASLGVDLPVTVRHNRAASAPYFLDRTDIRANRLEGLRPTGSTSTHVGASLRRQTPMTNPLLGLLIDGTALRVDYQKSQLEQMTVRSESERLSGGITYARPIARRDFGLLPGFVVAGLRAITPARIERSDAFERLVGARLRWTPESLAFGTTYAQQESRAYRFDRILALPEDSAVRPTVAPRQGLENNMRVAWRPLSSLRADFNATSSRNLLEAGRAATQERERAAIEAARTRLGGVDLGWEGARNINSQINYTPEIARWLQPRLTYSSNFRMDRRASYATYVPQGDDSVAVMLRDFAGNRSMGRSLSFDPRAFIDAAFGPADSASGRLYRTTYGLVRRIEAVNTSWTSQLSSQFQRDLAVPGAAYQLGFGSLDAFRFIDGDTAATTRASNSFQTSTSLRLPAGVQLRPEYSAREVESFGVQGGGQVDRDVSWPKFQLTWRPPSLPTRLRPVLRQIGFTAGYTADKRSTIIGGASDNVQTVEGTSIPMSVNVGLVGGLSLQYGTTITSRDAHTLNGATEDRSITHRASVSGMFNAPGALREHLTNPINTSAQFDYQAGQRCRYAPSGGEAEGCIPFNDVLTRGFSLTLDTVVQQFNFGLQLSYSDRQSYVGVRNGNSQFQLNMFGQFMFTAGDVTRR